MPLDADHPWGVDSSTVTHKPIPQLGNRTLFDWVVAQVGMVPQFWGRYIGLKPDPNVPLQSPLTADEADYIFSHSNKQCRILVVYNALNDTPPSRLPNGQRLLHAGSVRNDFMAGQLDVQSAVRAATDASVPADYTNMIYGDIEDAWQPTAEWIRGWWDGMRSSAYQGQGGLYANLNVPNFTQPYLMAQGLSPAGAGSRFLWSTQPVRGCVLPRNINFDYQPVQIPNCLDPVVLWQYGRDVYRGCLSGWADFNLCNGDGYDSMWEG
jgi:hypothetical protein